MTLGGAAPQVPPGGVPQFLSTPPRLTLLGTTRLEDGLQSKLYLPHGAVYGIQLSEGRQRAPARDGNVVCAGTLLKCRKARVRVIRVIKHVEELSPELNVKALGEFRVLLQGRVEGDVVGPEQGVSR